MPGDRMVVRDEIQNSYSDHSTTDDNGADFNARKGMIKDFQDRFSPKQKILVRKKCYRRCILGGLFLAAAMISGALVYFLYVQITTSQKICSSSVPLVDLFSHDLDEAFPALGPLFYKKLGAVLLYFFGYHFDPGEKKWTAPSERIDSCLSCFVDSIQPRWKGGGLNYDELIFDDGDTNSMAVNNTGSLMVWLSLNGLDSVSNCSVKDRKIHEALQFMSEWKEMVHFAPLSSNRGNVKRYLPTEENKQLPSKVLFAFAFGASNESSCNSIQSCQHPGQTNELIAHTILDYLVKQRQQEDDEFGNRDEKINTVSDGPQNGQFAEILVMAQWEIAVLLLENKTFPADHQVLAIGGPGDYLTTTDIWFRMFDELANTSGIIRKNNIFSAQENNDSTANSGGNVDDCATWVSYSDDDNKMTNLRTGQHYYHGAESFPSLQGLVVAHPDHLIRALKTGQLILAQHTVRWKNLNKALHLELSLFPFRLDWPAPTDGTSIVQSDSEKKKKENHTTGAELNLFLRKSFPLSDGQNHSFYDSSLGFSSSNSQPWVRDREIWLLYEMWARAKLVARSSL